VEPEKINCVTQPFQLSGSQARAIAGPHPHSWRHARSKQFTVNMLNFYRHIHDNHQDAPCAGMLPHIERSKPEHQQGNPPLYMQTVCVCLGTYVHQSQSRLRSRH
jgi:hypothetical protein